MFSSSLDPHLISLLLDALMPHLSTHHPTSFHPPLCHKTYIDDSCYANYGKETYVSSTQREACGSMAGESYNLEYAAPRLSPAPVPFL